MRRLSKEERIARGNDADRLLQDPVLAAVLDHYEREVVARWKRSAPGETALRERLHGQAGAGDLIRALLTRMRDDGRIAATAETEQTPTRGRSARR